MELKNFSLNEIESLVFNLFNVKANARNLPGEIDLNYHLTGNNNDEYILKIAGAGELFENLDFQNKAIEHLQSKNTGLDFPVLFKDRTGKTISEITDCNGEKRFVRLLSFIKGSLWVGFKPHSTPLLASLGETLGKVTKSLQDFDHAAVHRTYKWDVAQVEWIKNHIAKIQNPDDRRIVEYFTGLFTGKLNPVKEILRKSANYNDANDYNIIIDNTDVYAPKVKGFIDFGDMVYTYTISELAICLAYAMMDKENPLLAAIPVIEAYNQQFKLTEPEIDILFAMIAARLCISVVNSAIEKENHPENRYLTISEQPAWNLLRKLYTIHPRFAQYVFRNACNLEPNPDSVKVIDYLKSGTVHFGKVMDIDFENDKLTVFDFSIGSTEIGNHGNFMNTNKFTKQIFRKMEDDEAKAGIGKYNEARIIYSADRYRIKVNEGYEWRTVHLGIDIFAPEGSPVFAPLDAVVYSVKNNNAELDYGPTVILKHTPENNLVFYTLYGHLSTESLNFFKEGDKIKKGDLIAKLGNNTENGNWAPHLHFQIITDMLDCKGDFAGVCADSLRNVWLSVCPDPNLILQIPDRYLNEHKAGKNELLAVRKEILGRNLSISYKKPLLIERGMKQYLYDETGRAYLDTVNNVAHVGHQHPAVVEAATRQTAVLNTNTRYLHKNIVEFAQKLLTKFPDPLKVCFFVNSGSEANELALRMARNYTKSKETVVVEVGYHGNTNAIIEISSYKFDGPGGTGALPHIHKMPIPDTYRGMYGSNDPDAGKKYASHIKEAVDKIQREGKRVSSFICESILSCGGQIVLPDGYLTEAYKHIRNGGGLCIADEVQVGFGRVGEKFWAFETQGVIPDIVTLGKPIGNGHPLGAVVTTPEIAMAFANGMEYFNTFGGNPVSCAIGTAVFDTIEREQLQNNALVIGNYLMNGLRQLMTKHTIIGDVRGLGLFIGFEMVTNRETKNPATAQAAYLTNRMKEHGILMSYDGPFNNVIKIKPPVIFSKQDADFLLDTLDVVLGENYFRVES